MRSIHPRAEQELIETVAFYKNSGGARVAARFLDEFERVASLLEEHPGFGTPFDLPRRIYPLRVFPYSLVYRPVDEGIRVLAVRHQNRRPSSSQDRS